MVPGKPEDQNSYQGELYVQLGVICVIQIMESILGSTTLVVNRYDKISALRKALIHPEAVTSRWNQAGLVSSMYDIYHSIDFGM